MALGISNLKGLTNPAKKKRVPTNSLKDTSSIEKPSEEPLKPDILELINRRRRQIIVHSVLYYRHNTSVVSDHIFDQWCSQLVTLQADYPREASEAEWSGQFKNFDGSTGFHLTDNAWGLAKAEHVLEICRKKGYQC